jgi:quinoprotein glucose dehydrogenase
MFLHTLEVSGRCLSLILTFSLTGPLQAQSDWPVYGHDSGATRYSPLNQINTLNVAKLQRAWTYSTTEGILNAAPLTQSGRAGEPAGVPGRSANGGRGARTRISEVTPLVINGLMYLTTPYNRVVALEPETGKEIWSYELKDLGVPATRGLAYWPGDKTAPPTIFFGTTGGFLVAINVKTGKPVPGFANEGFLNLRTGVTEKFPNAAYGLSSPPAIYKDLVITGSHVQEQPALGPSGDVRAWDVHTGKPVWTFHTIPHPGEPGYDTWPPDYWKTAGSPANWGFGSVDAARGLIFLPIGQPASQYYGGHRAQQNLYSSSVVALDANTGAVRWHFQLTHHDVWDYDNAATPAQMDVVRDGKRIPAVVTVAKSGLMFFLERETGRPIYPVEERPVPKSDIPGEETWPTQPFPLKPPPLSRLSIKPDEIFTGEPAHEKFCRDLVEKIGGIHNLGPYTPYSSREFRIVFPGQQGGPNFGGVAIDPAMAYVFVNSRDVGGMGRMDKTAEGDQVAYRRFSPLGAGTVNARFWNPETSLPCQPPPWAHLIAVNANTGDIAWNVPLGTSDELEAKGIRNTGAFGQGGPIATAGGLVFIAGTIDKRFRAFDSRTGRTLWEGKLESEGHTTPMTYMAPNGKQYVVVVTTGVNAFALE